MLKDAHWDLEHCTVHVLENSVYVLKHIEFRRHWGCAVKHFIMPPYRAQRVRNPLLHKLYS